MIDFIPFYGSKHQQHAEHCPHPRSSAHLSCGPIHPLSTELPLLCVNASSSCPTITPVLHPVLSVSMSSANLLLVLRNLASFLYSFLFIIDFPPVIKICHFCLSHISHLAPSLLPPLFFLLTLDCPLQLPLFTAALGVVLMCRLEYSTPSAHFKVFDGPHGYHKLQNPFIARKALDDPCDLIPQPLLKLFSWALLSLFHFLFLPCVFSPPEG